MKKKVTRQTDEQRRIAQVLKLIDGVGQIDGDHHKTWVIDQIVRLLTGPGYSQWVKEYQEGEDGPETYPWDVGIAP